MARRPTKRCRGSPVTIGAIASLLCFLALAPPAGSYVYWTNPYLDQNAIGRADLDGTGLDSRFIPVATDGAYLRDLALDSKHVYWAAACVSEPPTVPCTNGAIGRADLDGNGGAEKLIDGINPGGVAVDSSHVYWTWTTCDGGWGLEALCTSDELAAGPGGVARANLDGSGIDLSFITGIDADQLAVDAGHIYWTGRLCEPGCSQFESAIGRADLDGSGVQPAFIDGLSRGFSGPNALALDASHIYWTGQIFDASPGPALGRANLDGTGVEPTLAGGITGLHSPFWTGVALDQAHLYWTTYEYGGEFIVRANLDGGDIQPFITAGGDKHFSPNALAVDSDTVARAQGNAKAAGTQRRTGRKIFVKVEVRAKEELSAKASGRIRAQRTYELVPQKVKVKNTKTRTLKLRPRKGAARRIGEALSRGRSGKAKVKVKLTDLAGNSKTEKPRVRLIRGGRR